ncbi:MAG: hypothetical protein ACU841_08445 [Gammaproteobacteria bacterium]
MKIRYFVAVFLFPMLVGCSATTTLSTVQPDAVIDVKDAENSGNPRSETLDTTSFGNYEFRVTGIDGRQFFGILPLKFNGGYLALDILFFAPGTFFNLREVFPLYRFDLDNRVVSYKEGITDPWTSYSPTEQEIDRAIHYFSER